MFKGPQLLLVGLGVWQCQPPPEATVVVQACGTCAGFLAADTMQAPLGQEPAQHRSQRCAFSEVGTPRGHREMWVGQMAQWTEFALQERGPEFYP